MPDPHLELAFQQRTGSLSLDVAFATSAPWTILFGPSGSGKSTILRVIAGFERPAAGRVLLGPGSAPEQTKPLGPPAMVVFDTAKRIFVLPHHRPVRSAAQQAWLIERKVRHNVFSALSSKDRTESQEDILRLFHLTHLADADVRDLSGGERQRVSVARAVVAAVTPHRSAGARLLLLDEPFAGMDAALRDALAPALRDFLAACRIPVLSVTHDVGEAFLLEAEVVRIRDGQVIAQGAAADVLAEERRRLISVLGSATESSPRDHSHSAFQG